MGYKDFCIEQYRSIYQKEFEDCNLKKPDDKRRYAQKIAIRNATVNAIREFPKVEPAKIWKTIYLSHINNVSGIADDILIANIISADQSWKKSSGHAFEEMVKELGNLALYGTGIKIILQKDLSMLLKSDMISNEVRDLSWLKEQAKSSVFDLYMTIEDGEKCFVYGCVQSKTSIRDRVTRDREPSSNAMKAYFWSIAIVLDGDFLRLPKYQKMVNGGSVEYKENGWHGMYVLTNEKITDGRIYATDIALGTFTDHALLAADHWKSQRQWFDNTWLPK